MASRDYRIKARLEARDDASRTVGAVEGRFKRLTTFLARSFVVTLGDVANAVRFVADSLGSFIRAANEQEAAVRRLDTALASLGPAAAGTSRALQEQASALQQLTQFGDEAIIQSQALLATLGVQAEQLPQATRATVDLASALGISLEASARNVGKTVGGFAGELGEVIPELKNLSTEALQAGAGIDLLARRFAGSAAANVDTYAGRVAQLTNVLGDLKESFGAAVTQNDRVNDSIESLTRTLSSEQTAALVADLAGGISSLVAASLEAAAALPGATQAVGDFVRGVGDAAEGAFGRFGDAARENAEALSGFSQASIDAAAASSPAVAAVDRWIQSMIELGAESRIAAGAQGDLSDSSRAVAVSSQQAAELVGALAQATGSAADSTARLNGELGTARTGLERLGAALDVVTSAQLAREVQEIEQNLAKARAELGANADEYVRLEAVAAEKIERLRERIQSLRDGQGDLVESTREAVAEWELYGDAAERAAGATDLVTASSERATAALERQVVVAERAGASLGGGGSQLGTTPFNFAGGRFTFLNGRRVRVLPDGRVEAA